MRPGPATVHPPGQGLPETARPGRRRSDPGPDGRAESARWLPESADSEGPKPARPVQRFRALKARRLFCTNCRIADVAFFYVLASRYVNFISGSASHKFVAKRPGAFFYTPLHSNLSKVSKIGFFKFTIITILCALR